MLKGIEFARRRDWPFLGTCGGFQYALIECVRNVLGIKDADSAENNSGSKNIVIYPVACAVPDRAKGAPKLSGPIPEIRLRPGSYLQSYYSQDTVAEEFFCNFEVNPDYEWAAMEAGIPGGGARPARRDSRHRIAHPPFLYRDAVPAATLFPTRQAASPGAGVRASRRRLGKKKAGRQRAGVNRRQTSGIRPRQEPRGDGRARLSDRAKSGDRPLRSRPPEVLVSSGSRLTSGTVNRFPDPATSNVACGFPALRSPVGFKSRVIRPVGQEQLSRVLAVSAYSRCKVRACGRSTRYSTVSIPCLYAVWIASDAAGSSFLPSL